MESKVDGVGSITVGNCPSLPLPFHTRAAGVGDDEDPVAPVDSPNVASSIHTPSDTKPHFGQVIDDPSEEVSRLRGKESWDVFSQEPSGFRFPQNSHNFAPEITLVTRRETFSCKAVWLAREPG
jgi:hypothetical protein